jgi:hypothetical protein
MTSEEKHTLDRLFLRVGEVRGHVEEGFKRLDGRMASMEADVSVIRQDGQTANQRVALLEQTCATRGKRISELVKRVDMTENTGATLKVQATTAWKTMAVIGGIIVALGGLALGFIQIFS